MDLAAPLKRLSSHRTGLVRRPRLFASHRIRSRCVPRIRQTHWRSTPDDVAADVRTVHCQVASHVPSSWFLTTSTVCSLQVASGLLRPEAGRGSLRFPMNTPTMADRSRRPMAESSWRSPVSHRFPQRGSHPSKNSPRQ